MNGFQGCRDGDIPQQIGVTANDYNIGLFLGDVNALKLEVIVAQLFEYTEITELYTGKNKPCKWIVSHLKKKENQRTR